MIADRIRQARLAAGLTLGALGEKVGVSHTAIQKYEKGFAISIMSISLVTELFGSKGEAAVTWLALGPALGLVAMFLRGSTKLRWPKSSRYE